MQRYFSLLSLLFFSTHLIAQSEFEAVEEYLENHSSICDRMGRPLAPSIRETKTSLVGVKPPENIIFETHTTIPEQLFAEDFSHLEAEKSSQKQDQKTIDSRDLEKLSQSFDQFNPKLSDEDIPEMEKLSSMISDQDLEEMTAHFEELFDSFDFFDEKDPTSPTY